MNSNSKKGLKPFVLKIIAVAMSFCYLLGPSHQEVKTLLHAVTHNLEMPENIIGHTSLLKETTIHTNHDIVNVKRAHHHSLIDAISFAMESFDNEKGTKTPRMPIKKIDKHVRSYKDFKQKIASITVIIEQEFEVVIKQTQNGFLNFLDQPPQDFS